MQDWLDAQTLSFNPLQRGGGPEAALPTIFLITTSSFNPLQRGGGPEARLELAVLMAGDHSFNPLQRGGGPEAIENLLAKGENWRVSIPYSGEAALKQ